MASRKYYSVRSGKNPLSSKIPLPDFLQLFYDLYKEFEINGYFQEAFGYHCVDEGFVPGKLGIQIEAKFFRKLKKRNIWPIDKKYQNYSEEDTFDVIELFYDLISKPIEGNDHSFNNCGLHYFKFDAESGKREYRSEINDLLIDFGNGFELSIEGEILTLPERGLENLLDANLPEYDPENVENKINLAINKFRRYKSSLEERKNAIRELADVLEYLRPKCKAMISKKDESDLFELANNFGIRHHNNVQKTDYDKSIWYSWIFYYYLATIHASLRLITLRDGMKK